MPDITFHSIDSENRVLGSALVKVYNLDGSVLQDYGTTSVEDGSLVLDLSAGTYWVRAYKSEYAFNKRLKVTVGSSDESINLVGTSTVDYLPSGSSEVCRVSGIMYGASGEPIESGHITFVLPEDKYRVNTSGLLTSTVVRGVSDKFGRISFELFRSAKYECRIKSREDESIIVTVPDLEVCKLSDLIFPVGTVFSTESTVSGTKGSELKSALTYELSLGRELADGETLSDFFEISGKASISEKHIHFETKAAGAYTVKVYGINKGTTLLGSAKKLLKTIEVTIND